MNWIDYWNGKPTIYVSPRHQEAHDFGIAFSVIPFIRHPRAHVLDFGCGDTTRAPLVANHCSKLHLWDAAPCVRSRLTTRFGADERISVLTPDALAALEPNSIDLITIVSVVQYLEPDALSQVLQLCRRLLSDHGVLIIADVVPPNIGVFQDAWQLLSFAYQEGFALRAGLGLMKTALSDYATVRSRLRLKKYSEQEFITVLGDNAFASRRLESNIGHNRLRMAYEGTADWRVATPKGSDEHSPARLPA